MRSSLLSTLSLVAIAASSAHATYIDRLHVLRGSGNTKTLPAPVTIPDFAPASTFELSAATAIHSSLPVLPSTSSPTTASSASSTPSQFPTAKGFNVTGAAEHKIELGSGPLAIGTYKFVFDIKKGLLWEMTVIDDAGKVLADTHPGYGWDNSFSAWEIAFTLNRETSGVKFEASMDSKEVSGTYSIVSIM